MTETYYVMTGQSTLYFQVEDGVVMRAGKRTQMPFYEFVGFLRMAETLGLHTGKL